MFPVLCIGGPTGAGKDSIVSHFLDRNPDTYIRILRSTTRPRRNTEQEGIHYNFLSDKDFATLESEGIICAIDIFCGFKYGINIKDVIQRQKEKRRVIGVFGACSFDLKEKLKGEVILIYVSAPVNTLHNRLLSRGDKASEIAKRLPAAKIQLRDEPVKFDHTIVNTGTIDESVLQLERIIESIY